MQKISKIYSINLSKKLNFFVQKPQCKIFSKKNLSILTPSAALPNISLVSYKHGNVR